MTAWIGDTIEGMRLDELQTFLLDVEGWPPQVVEIYMAPLWAQETIGDVPLTAAVFGADDQPRDEHGRWTSDGGGGSGEPTFQLRDGTKVTGLAAAANAWNGSMKWTDRIQEQADALVRDSPPMREDAEADVWAREMLTAVAEAPPTTEPLYRGINVPYDGTGESGRYAVGEDVEFSLGSFTEQKSWADQFMESGGTPRSGTPIRFVLEPGARALSVDPIVGPPAEGQRAENEWVTGGRFVVTGVKPIDPIEVAIGGFIPGGTQVTLRQTEPPKIGESRRHLAVAPEVVLDPNLSGSLLALRERMGMPSLTAATFYNEDQPRGPDGRWGGGGGTAEKVAEPGSAAEKAVRLRDLSDYDFGGPTGRGWGETSDAARPELLRRQREAFEVVGEPVRYALQGWSVGNDLPAWRDAWREHQNGEPVSISKDPGVGYDRREFAEGAEGLFEILDASVTDATLHRGGEAYGTAATEAIRNAKPGDVLDVGLSSWSRSEEVADVFRGIHTRDRPEVATYMMHLEPGAHGVDMAVLGMHSFAWQEEVMVGGPLEVVRSEQTADGVYDITVRAKR